MNEDEKKEVQSQCWKTIFIAIALLAIGAVLGHLLTVRYLPCPMMGRCGPGYGMKACWDKGKCAFSDKFCDKKRIYDKKRICDKKDWHSRKYGKECKPGCTCPKCSKKAHFPSKMKKAPCPLTGVKMADPNKEME